MIKNQPASSEQPIYKKIQNYIFKFSDLLGQGNFSKVYKAHHELTNDIVAIKIVELESLKSKKLEQLLFSEIDVLKKLNHANILKCYEVFTSNRNCYIITQLCNEGDLESRLRKERYFSELKAEAIIKDIFEGLCYLADKNVIHRDVKVANIFISNSKVKIADFGFAKFTKETFKDINIGSPIYMSPEGFVDNIYGPKTDVWAFGILIYELLHGETPYSSCRTENELKQALMVPLSKNKLKPQLSNEIKQAILRCVEIDHNKRISMHELANMPYFRRIFNKDQIFNSLPLNPIIHGNYGSALELRLRSPSYNGQNKMLRSEQADIKRKVSIEKPISQFNPSGVMKMTPPYQKNSQNYIGIAQTSKNYLEIPNEEAKKDRRAISTERQIFMIPNSKQQPKNQHSVDNNFRNGTTQSNNKFYILSSSLSFKECVNILHYGRLIFKFLLTLRISEYCNDNELFKLSKWLMQLLSEMSEKIVGKEVIYEGENAAMREQKLKQVRNEYQKKYRTQLSNYITGQMNFGEQFYNLDYIKTYCYNLFQKYDSMILKENNKSLIMLGHCIIMICDTTRLLKRCFEEHSYSVFVTYKDIEGFLNIAKDQIDFNSYLDYKKRMLIYV